MTKKAKSVHDMTPEEREAQRLRWKLEKRAERALRKYNSLPTAEEAVEKFSRSTESLELDAHAKQFEMKVMEELNRMTLSYAESYVIDIVSRTLFGLKKGLIQEVTEPDGEFVAGMYFADSIGNEVLEATHRYNLIRSPTFRASYEELLQLLDKRYGQDKTQDAQAIKLELAGKYFLPPELKHQPEEPKPEPKPEPTSSIPSTGEMLIEG